MAGVAQGDTVSICFRGKLDNGEVFKEIPEKEPFTVTLGQQELPPTVEMAMLGRNEGESFKVRIPPEEGYGGRQKILIQEVPKEKIGLTSDLRPGMILSLTITKDGEQHKVPATVIEVKADKVVVDYNHPLAGHHLTYEITILKRL